MKKQITLALCLPLILGVFSCSADEVDSAPIYAPMPFEDGSGNFSAASFGEFSYITDERYGEKEPFLNVYSSLLFLLQQELWEAGTSLSSSKTGDNEVSYFINAPSKGDITITVDALKDMVTFSDYEAYRSLGSTYYNEMASVNGTGILSISSNVVDPTPRNPFTFDLGEYDIDILMQGENAYIPVASCSYLFTDPRDIFITWNGDAFYFYNSTNYMFYGEDYQYSDFAKQYYGRSLSNTTPSQDVATLHGNESMFYLDHFYGFPDREDFAGKKFSEYLKENHREEYDLFFSNGKEDSQKAWGYVARQVIGDGHTGTSDGLGSFYVRGAYVNEYEWSDRDLARSAIDEQISKNRQEAWGLDEYELPLERMYETYEDMAVIRFDAFNKSGVSDDSQDEAYYREKMADDLYSLFAYSFMQMEKSGGIEKVVIDLTGNGGGAAVSCMEALSFLKDDFHYSLYNSLTGAFTKTTYRGKLPGRSASYAGEYEFYVLTSGCSFSCGNLFPNICKNNGMAKIVGQKSGGGACIVSNLITPDGQWLQLSGLNRICLNDKQESNDGGIEPDIVLDMEKFTDLAALRAALN